LCLLIFAPDVAEFGIEAIAPTLHHCLSRRHRRSDSCLLCHVSGPSIVCRDSIGIKCRRQSLYENEICMVKLAFTLRRYTIEDFGADRRCDICMQSDYEEDCCDCRQRNLTPEI